MNDQEFTALKRWIAHDPSDTAQAVREAIAPTVQELIESMRQALELAPDPDRYVMTMRAKMYSRLLPQSRQKLQPYVRKVWRSRR